MTVIKILAEVLLGLLTIAIIIPLIAIIIDMVKSLWNDRTKNIKRGIL